MRLLILTQKVDRDDSVLGFFHGWIIEFAKHFESILVICLEEGEHNLPSNVSVYSLGKEKNKSRIKYVWRFYKYIFSLRTQYDAVFVHMNQEYVLLGGIPWRLMSKTIILWRNHLIGNFLTRLSVLLSGRVMCTSDLSFTARFKKTLIMPVGVDTNIFKPGLDVCGDKKDVLCLGRISPVKRIENIISAFSMLEDQSVRLLIVGSVSEKDVEYGNMLKELVVKSGLNERVLFLPAVLHSETPHFFQTCGVYVNTTQSGSFDKTIIEAMACGAVVLTSNNALKGMIDDICIAEEGDIVDLKNHMTALLGITDDQRKGLSQKMVSFVQNNHSLRSLASKLKSVIIGKI